MEIIDTSTLPQDLSSLDEDTRYWLYNGLDCCLTFEIFDKLMAQLDEVDRVTYRRGMSLAGCVMEMMLNGLLVDVGRRQEVIKEFEEKLTHLEEIFRAFCVDGLGLDKPFNHQSPPQVQWFFYDYLGLKAKRKRNKSGGVSFVSDRDALEAMSIYPQAAPFIKVILAMRDCSKALGFLRTKLDSDGRMRTSLNVAGTNTGRLNSSFSDSGTGTNLQNIDGSLKDIFIAPKGYMIVDIDAEQADSRNVAAFAWNLLVESHGPEYAGRYLDACESGDLHTSVCRMAWEDLSWPKREAFGSQKSWMEAAKLVAEMPAYREMSFRDLAKRLGHGCLTKGHEVLTPSGWVPIENTPTTIMQWSEKGSCFVDTSHWEAKPYSGELQFFEGNSISAVMTHDHRVPYKADLRSSGIKERPASAGPQAFMPLGNGWIGGEEIVPARLIAAFMADGHQEKDWMAFHFHKERKKLRLKKLCDDYGYAYRVHGNKIRVLGKLPKHPGPFQFAWTKTCLEEFVDELKYWDGAVGKTSVTIFSSRKQDLEWFQTFGRLVGVGGSISKPYTSGFGSTVYRLQQNSRQWANGASVTHTRVPVNACMVYCPTVPSGWFYVRRKGKIFVTGNTNYLGQAPQMARAAHLKQQLVETFQQRYFAGFPCIKDWQNHTIKELQTTRQITNLFGRRRTFWDDPTAQSTINAAIAYGPQGSTGEFINEGWKQLFRARARTDWDIHFILQVHDSLVLLIPENTVNELLPTILSTMLVTIPLKNDRGFSIPLGCKAGWNYGKYDYKNPDKNPYGLKVFSASEGELRKPPRREGFMELMQRPL